MQIIGIVGGVASGKSMVAQQLAKLGAGVFDADAAGHEVLRLPHIEKAVRQRWGNVVFDANGRVDRAKLAAIVFRPGNDGKKEREYLERLTHPEIARLFQQKIMALSSAGAAAVVLDAALLIETGWDHWCEKILFVDVPREVRQLRAKERGWGEEDFAAREGVQESLDQKRVRADVIIDNSGSSEQTQAQIEQFWASLVR